MRAQIQQELLVGLNLKESFLSMDKEGKSYQVRAFALKNFWVREWDNRMAQGEPRCAYPLGVSGVPEDGPIGLILKKLGDNFVPYVVVIDDEEEL